MQIQAYLFAKTLERLRVLSKTSAKDSYIYTSITT